MTTSQSSWGLGLRPAHFQDYYELPDVPPLEIMTDNLLFHRGGPALYHTQSICARAPFVVLHGIGLNIGGADAVSTSYLNELKRLIDLFNPKTVSDHLCFTQAGGLQSYELLPIVRNAQMLEHVIRNVDFIQQYLGRQVCLENVSAYVEYLDDDIPEGDFLNAVADKTDCGVLLDINNVFVSAKNFGRHPADELSHYNLTHVRQIHIAGHSVRDDFLFDTHDAPVCNDVWNMLKDTLQHIPDIPVFLENDNDSVPLNTLIEELRAGQNWCAHEKK